MTYEELWNSQLNLEKTVKRCQWWHNTDVGIDSLLNRDYKNAQRSNHEHFLKWS